MRYVGLIFFLICIPLLSQVIRSNMAVRRLAWVGLGVSPFIYPYFHLSVSVISWAFWPGYVKGMIVALPDLLAIALLLTTPAHKVGVGIKIAFAFYFAAALLSVASADAPMASIFFVWQLARVFLTIVAVARVSTHSEAPRHIVYGLCYGVAFQAIFSIYQRFAGGVVQASGTMGHQNLLGMMTHFALLLAFALILAGDRHKILKVGVPAALIAVSLTGSRGTVGFAAAGLVLLLVLSLLRKPTARKWGIAAAGVGAMLAAAPIVYLTLNKRFTTAVSEGGYDERAAFERAAKMMWSDHPMGVGANEYVVTANVKGYSEKAGVVWNGGSRAANVHNAYLLTAAELGWAGLITFILLWIIALLTALRTAWAKPVFPYNDLAIGVSSVMVTVCLHNFYEWIFVTEAAQYLFGITLGLAIGLQAQQRMLARSRSRLHKAATDPKIDDIALVPAS